MTSWVKLQPWCLKYSQIRSLTLSYCCHCKSIPYQIKLRQYVSSTSYRSKLLARTRICVAVRSSRAAN